MVEDIKRGRNLCDCTEIPMLYGTVNNHIHVFVILGHINQYRTRVPTLPYVSLYITYSLSLSFYVLCSKIYHQYQYIINFNTHRFFLLLL